MHTVKKPQVLLVNAVHFFVESGDVDQCACEQNISEEGSEYKGGLQYQTTQRHLLHEEDARHNNRPHEIEKRLDYDL